MRRGRVRILTRNSRRDSVQKWLQMRGAIVPPVIAALKHRSKFVVKISMAARLVCVSCHSLQLELCGRRIHEAPQTGSSSSSNRSVLFVDSVAEHLDDGFKGFICVTVLVTRGVKVGNADDDS